MAEIPGIRRKYLSTALGSLTALFLCAPLLVVALISFSSSRYLEFPPPGFSLRWYAATISDPSWRQAFVLSGQVAIVVAVSASILGSAAAWGLANATFRGRSLMIAVAISPMVVPAIVLAVGMYVVCAQLRMLETKTALIVCHTVLAMPVVFISVFSSLSALDRSIEVAARTLGASSWEAIWRVTIPSIWPGILVGFLFAFLTSFDEPVISLFVAGTHTVTLPKRMWDGIQYEIDPTAAAVSTMLVAGSGSLVLLSAGIRRSWERRSRRDHDRP